MNERIAQRNTGHVSEFAADIGLSRSSFFEHKAMLECMVQKFDASIVFNPAIHSYVYDRPGKLVISITWNDNQSGLILPGKPSANTSPLPV